MNRLVRNSLGVLVLILVITSMADVAESRHRRSDQLEEVVVTATRTEVPVSRVTGSVTVITREDIEQRQFPDVREILRDVPGLTIVETGSRGGTTSVFPRGGNANFTMVLIDGVKVNDAGGAFDFANLTTDNVERIEILRGPQSALYGSDAIGGVINIITRKGHGPGELTLGAMGGAGRGLGTSMTTHQERASAAGANDRFDYSAAFSNFDHAGLFRLNNEFRNRVFSGNLGFQARPDLSLRTTLRYTDSVFHFPTNSQGVPVAPNQGQERTLITLATQANYQLKPWWDHQLQWSHMEHRFKFFHFPGPDSARFSQTDGTQRRDMLDYHTNLRMGTGAWSGSVATAGIEFQEERLSQSNAVNPGTSSSTNLSRRNVGYYGQIQAVYAERVFLTPGIRLEENEFFGEFVNPKISGGYLHKETATKLRGSIGRGIRAPSFSELIGFPNSNIPSNFNLKPEKTKSWEVGLDQELRGKVVTGSVTYFHNDFKDLIALSTGINANIQGAVTRGWETLLTWKASKEFSISASHTFLETRVTDTGGVGGTAFVQGGPLLRRPKHSAALRADYQTSGWGLNSVLLYVGDRLDRDFAINPAGARVMNSSYLRLDLAGWYRLGKFEGADWTVKVRIENATDTHFQEAVGFPAPGVFALAGLEATF